MNLTTRQREVYEAIVVHWRQNGIGPTVRDLMAATGISSPNGVVCHLKALEKKGAVESGCLARCVWPAGLRERIQTAARGMELLA